MSIESLGLEGAADRVADGEKMKAWRSRATGFVTSLDDVFDKIETKKTEYQSEPAVVTKLNELATTIKNSMQAVIDAH